MIQTTRDTTNESATGSGFLLIFTVQIAFDINLLNGSSVEFQSAKTQVEVVVSKTRQAPVLCSVLHILHIYSSYCTGTGGC